MLDILIVDDEYTTIEGLKRFVPWDKIGYTGVYTARNAAQALEVLKTQLIDVLLTDISMPMTSGIELAAEVRKLVPDIRVVIISAYADKNNLMSALHLQVDDFIEKPVDLDEVEEVLGKLAKKLFLFKNSSKKDIRLIAAEGLKSTDSIVNGVKAYVENNYMRPELSLSDISKDLFISMPYMCAVFKKNTGATIKDYINEFRIRYALQILKESHLKLYEVAEKVGYNNYSYFSRLFKNETRKNPKDCR